MQATLDLALNLNCEFANFYVAMAYPGSQLYNDALRKDWPLPETWNGYSQHAVDTLPLPTKYLSAAEVLRFRDDAFQIYFKNPNYLTMISRKFGTGDMPRILAKWRPTSSNGGTLPEIGILRFSLWRFCFSPVE